MSIFKETNNTQLAREHLLKYTDISIKVITLEQFINESKHNYKGLEGANGAIEKRGDHFAIGLKNNKPETHENTFVHEILHKILHYENFPEVRYNIELVKNTIPQNFRKYLPRLAAYFSSVITHPEIYLRMRDNYDLKMEDYFDSLVIQKKVLLSNKGIFNSPEEEVFSNQQLILDGLEYFYYNDNQKRDLLTIFRNTSDSAYMSCRSLYKAVKKIGVYNPQSCLKAAALIRSHITSYGTKRSIGIFNKFWNAMVFYSIRSKGFIIENNDRLS